MKKAVEHSGVFTRRALLMLGGQVAVLGTLGGRLYQVQVRDGARYTTLADENRISARMIAPPRGRILDRFGVLVAGSSTNWRAVLIAEQDAHQTGKHGTALARSYLQSTLERGEVVGWRNDLAAFVDGK